jgi:hypothetical protein
MIAFWRVIQILERIIIMAATNSAAIAPVAAYNETTIARIGHHNDCLLASYTDFGTYNNYGCDKFSSYRSSSSI